MLPHRLFDRALDQHRGPVERYPKLAQMDPLPIDREPLRTLLLIGGWPIHHRVTDGGAGHGPVVPLGAVVVVTATGALPPIPRVQNQNGLPRSLHPVNECGPDGTVSGHGAPPRRSPAARRSRAGDGAP